MTDNISCPALNPRKASNENLVSCAEAFNDHGISIRHGCMQTNGELRFRLICADGSAYIRTQTSSRDEGWQNSHYHRNVRETYVVESGWIGYAELRGNKAVLIRYRAGEVFTTEPNVIHNIFMPKGAVIHTVKHRAGELPTDEKSDWIGKEKDPRVGVLQRLLGKTFSGPTEIQHFGSETLYNSAYRHFDNLIWQTPIWSTGFFAAMGASVASDASKTFVGDFATVLGVSARSLEAVILIFFGLFVGALGYALYRFRRHQIGTRPWPLGDRSPRLSPQVLLQMIVTVEAILLTSAAAMLFGWNGWFVLYASLAILCAATLLLEYRLIKHDREFELHRARIAQTRGEYERAAVQGAS